MDALSVGGSTPGESLDHALATIAETAEAAESVAASEVTEGSGAEADSEAEHLAAQSREAGAVVAEAVSAEIRIQTLEEQIARLREAQVAQDNAILDAQVSAAMAQVQAEHETPLDGESTLDTASNESAGISGTGTDSDQREPDRPPKRDHWWWRKLFN